MPIRPAVRPIASDISDPGCSMVAGLPAVMGIANCTYYAAGAICGAVEGLLSATLGKVLLVDPSTSPI